MGYQDLSTRGEKTFALGGTYTDKKTGKKYYNPVEAEGFFLGSRKKENVESKKGFDWLYQLEGTVKDRTGKVIFTGKFDVWGKTHMDNQMETARKNAMTLIQFLGFQDPSEVRPGRKPMYLFKCRQDAESVRPGSEIEQNTPVNDADVGAEPEEIEDTPAEVGEAIGSSEGEEFEEEAALDAEEVPADEVPAQPAKRAVKAASKASQGEVQRLLSTKPAKSA